MGEVYRATDTNQTPCWLLPGCRMTDGLRFLVKVAVDKGKPARMQVVTNWPSLVER
jgi:hypothetical protein